MSSITTTDVKTTWNIDPTHSEVQFRVKHLVISTVTGHFKSFNATADVSEDDFEDAEVYFEADVRSLTTNNEDRDKHLNSDDFFNTEKHPKITFRSSSMEKTGDRTYELTGDLTIRDVTKKVTLDVTYGGMVDDPYGQTKAGFEVRGSINRKEFGLTWSAVTEAGNVVVGDKVDLIMNVQFVKSD